MKKKGKDNIQWTDYTHEILLTYNNQMKHSATEFTPKEARKPSNELKVRLNLTMKGKKNRIYPELDVGDEVKIFKKRKPNEKERVSNWSQNIYTIENIENKLGQNYYGVEGNDRQYLRFELLQVWGEALSAFFTITGWAHDSSHKGCLQSRQADHLSPLRSTGMTMTH